MHKKIGIKKSINMIRHIIISSGIKNMNLEERVQMAKNSFHSIQTQKDYNGRQKKTNNTQHILIVLKNNIKNI